MILLTIYIVFPETGLSFANEKKNNHDKTKITKSEMEKKNAHTQNTGRSRTKNQHLPYVRVKRKGTSEMVELNKKKQNASIYFVNTNGNFYTYIHTHSHLKGFLPICLSKNSNCFKRKKFNIF